MNPKITAAEIASYLGVTVQAIHQRIKALNLRAKKSSNRIHFGHDIARVILKKREGLRKICISVIKGGVGKTTITEALAVNASLYGLKVLCIDVDQQANLTKGLNATEEAKKKPILIDIVAGNQNASNSIVQISEGLDLIPSRLDNVVLDNHLMTNRINPASIFHNIFDEIQNNYDLIVIDCPSNPWLNCLCFNAI